MSLRIAVIVGALCAAPLFGLAAQQASDSARVLAPARDSVVQSSSAPATGPRLAPAVSRAELSPAPIRAADSAYLQSGRHTFTISTLALVLGVVVLVLLIT
ncbi:MAG: hypothetical protein A2085_07680 [Gemmatimonadetes bacterium GWC2_71_10]|nr:MAG: hypothetical protein A2085_07680 [Gemmatimonadetes bacterium GWC2_71_10]